MTGIAVFLGTFLILFFVTIGMAITDRLPGSEGMKSYWTLIFCFALAWYNVSTVWVAQLVMYPLYRFIGSAGFILYHRSYDARIPIPVIIPAVLLMIFSVLLIWFRHATTPPWAAWTGAILQVVNAISTLVLQVPIHVQLDETGFSESLVAKLIATNWIRTTAATLHAVLMVWIVAGVLLGGLKGGRVPQPAE